MPLDDRELARWDERGALSLRAGALPARWQFNDLATRDGHVLRCGFGCCIRAVDRAADRKMLEEQFRSARNTVTIDDAAARLFESLRQSARQVALRFTADEWLDDAPRDEMRSALQRAGEATAFACGLEILPPLELQLFSPTAQQQRLDALHRELSQQRSAEQANLLQQAENVLRQFQKLRELSPGLAPGHLLEQMNSPDRGRVLETLLLASGAAAPSTEALWTPAGSSLYRIDLAAPDARAEPVFTGDAAGPFRSVHPAQLDGAGVLLIGARRGVILLDPQRPAEPRVYLDPGVTSALGFSRALLRQGWIFASHGERGVACWRLDAPAEPARALDLPPVQQVCRIAPASGSSLAISIDGRLLMHEIDGGHREVASVGSAIVEMLEDPRGLVIVCEDGQVLRLPQPDASPQALATATVEGPVSSGALLPWLGSARLLLGSAGGSVTCIGLDDTLMTRYASPHHGVAALAATGRTVAAVSLDRQRIILWNSWDGRRPRGELHLAATLRHRIAGACFSPAESG